MLRAIPLAVVGTALLAAVAAFWGQTAELLNRALVVAVVGWRVWEITRAPIRTSAPRAWTASGLTLAALGLMPPAWFLLAQMGPRPVLLWWLAVCWLGWSAAELLRWGGAAGVRAFSFPLIFLLFTLPAPQRLEQPVQTVLQEITTTLSATLIPTLGIECRREGFVLSLPGGDLGVLEACSGIRSLFALTALAALIAHLRGWGPIRGALFVLLSLPVVVASNVFRVTVSGILQETWGVNAVHGTPHDVLGFVATLLGLALLLGISWAAGASSATAEGSAAFASPRPAIPSRFALALSAGVLVVSIAGAILGYRGVKHQLQAAPLEQLAYTVGEWQGEELSIPPLIQEKLLFDRATQRVYRNQLGQEVHVWVIFWSSGGSVRGYHHPDVCWPNRGWTVTGREVKPIEAAGTTVPVTVRRFEQNGRRQIIGYWSQEGNRLLTDADEEAAQLEGTPRHRWVRERLFGPPVERSGRISVLVGTDVWGEGGYVDRSLWSFCAAFTEELVRVVPWAQLRPSVQATPE